MERERAKADVYNSLAAGGVTGGILGAHAARTLPIQGNTQRSFRIYVIL